MKWLVSILLLMATPAWVIPVFGGVSDRCYNNTVVVQDIGGHGSGVMVTRGGTTSDSVTFVWTVGHIAEHFMLPNGTFRSAIIKQGDKIAQARVLRCGDCYAAHDIALLQIIGGDLKGNAQFYRAFNGIKLGQEIIHCGSPYNTTLNGNLLFYGHISHIRRVISLPFMPVPREMDQCNIIAYPGCSGGPVFDAKTGDIVGFMSLGGPPGLAAIVPTRIVYEWAKSHDCLWAFDPEVPLPKNIVSWRCDMLDRLIKERNTSEIDSRWGSELELELELEPGECSRQFDSGLRFLYNWSDYVRIYNSRN